MYMQENTTIRYYTENSNGELYLRNLEASLQSEQLDRIEGKLDKILNALEENERY